MGTRADNLDGSCREVISGRHAGKWRVQFTLADDAGFKRRISRLFKTKTEAKTFLQQLRRGERTQEARRSREPTLGEWFDWLAENDWPETLSEVTIAQRRARFRNYVRARFGKTPLSGIDPLAVRAYYKQLRQGGVSDSVVLSIKSDLVRAFNQAVTPYQRVPMTVANPFRLPLQAAQPRTAVALTPEEVGAALDRPGLNDSQRALLGLFLLAGLRLGEAMAITRGQLLFDHGRIVVDRSVKVAYGGRQAIGSPKGDKTRNAVMCATLADLLRRHVGGMESDELLWSCASENKPRMKKRFYAFWRESAALAGLPAEMTPHDCRLTHINIIEKHMPEVSQTTLKEHVGHAATGVTEANYTRPLTSSQQVLRRELDRVFGFAALSPLPKCSNSTRSLIRGRMRIDDEIIAS